MAQRLNRRSVSFNILPRESSGDVDTLSSVCFPPAIYEITAGSVRRRRRKQKCRKSSTSMDFAGAGLRPDVCPDDGNFFENPLVQGRGFGILESDGTAVGQERVAPFVGDRVLTEYSCPNMQLSNGSQASSSKQMKTCVVLSQLELSRQSNCHPEDVSFEQPKISGKHCMSDSSVNRILVATCEKASEGDQLMMVEGKNGILETVGDPSASAPPHDYANKSQLFPSLTKAASHPDPSWTARNGDGFCYIRSTTEDLLPAQGKASTGIGSLHSETQESVDIGSSSWSEQLPRSGLRQRTAHLLENDSSAAQGDNAFNDFILNDEGTASNKCVSEGMSALHSKAGDQECQQCNPSTEVPVPTPVVLTGLSQTSEWEQLMAGSQPADVAPLKYFLGEVMQARAVHSGQPAENDKKRQHVYNTMFHVPWRCELLIIVGFFVCLDSFLSLLTVMPLRLIIFFWRCVFNRRQFRRPHADELSDLCSFLVLVSGVTLLQQADISFIYHMIRSQATIKLYVVYNVLEIFDKLCQSFGSDVLQVVLNSADSVATCSTDLLLFEAFRFAMDQCIAIVSFVVHSLIILAQSITVSAALRSHNNALFTLLISNNFAEIKSNVFKRLAKDNLHKLAYLDTVERFHILAHLFFVLAQNLLAANEPWLLAFASNAGMVLLCEVLVDSIKHAFLAKFNDIKPAAYSEFLQALCKQTLNTQSHDVHKTLSFVPLAPACVVIRVLIPLYGAYLPGAPFFRLICIVMYSIMTFMFLVMVKVLVGLGLLKHASWYVERCRKKEKYFHAD